jgi:hypothetical protein
MITAKHSVSRPDLVNVGWISAEGFWLAICVRAPVPRSCLADRLSTDPDSSIEKATAT